MLKNACFLENPVKFASSVAPPPDLHVVTFTYDYNFIEFVSSVKCVSLTSKKDKMTHACSAVTLSALLHLFFTSSSCRFYDGERKNIACPRVQGTLATPLRFV